MSICTFLLFLLLCPTGVFPCLGNRNQAQKGSVTEAQSPTTVAVESDPKSWKEFSEPGRFRVTFPGNPVEADNSTESLPGRKFTLNTTAYYLVGYQEVPTNVVAEMEKHVEIQKLLFDRLRDGMRDGIQARTKVNLLEESGISINGYSGRSLKIGMENGGVARQHSYLIGPRLYQILVVTPKESLAADGGKFDEMRATKFLNSFRPSAAVEEKLEAWRVYSSTQGRFSITFPGTPSDKDVSYDTPMGRCDARDYVLITTAEYRVSYTDFVVDLEEDSNKRNEILDSIRDRVVAEFKAKVSTQNSISLDGHPGRMMTLTATDGSITRTKSYTVGKRLYQIMVTTSRLSQPADGGRLEESWATKFFDSFKLAKPE
jgi:hypothetical protein